MTLSSSRWLVRNIRCLAVFGPLLVATGTLGFLRPPARSLMSVAPPYNVFHIVSGSAGTAIAIAKQQRAAAGFNVVFGLLDLYQGVASVTDMFPAQLFRLRPADLVVHVVLGTFLVGLGTLGLLQDWCNRRA
jgi:hypothetical protein